MSTPHRPTPEDQGVPDYADDDSTAFSEQERPRLRDSPPAMPADEPQAVDEFGLTGPEARAGEPLADRLEREEPDLAPDTGGAPVDEPAVRERSEEEAEPDPEGGTPGGEYPPLP